MKNHNCCSRLQLFAAVFLLIIATPVSAALVDRGGGLIYDTDQHITWLRSVNLYEGTWYEAMSWADNLNYYDSVRNVIWNDWRLPVTVAPDPTCGIDIDGWSSGCTGGEMSHAYYYDQLNFGADYFWYGTEESPDSAYLFIGWTGGLSWNHKNNYPHFASNTGAWAVRDGDVATVPLPAAFWLFGSGLIGLIGIAHKRKAV